MANVVRINGKDIKDTVAREDISELKSAINGNQQVFTLANDAGVSRQFQYEFVKKYTYEITNNTSANITFQTRLTKNGDTIDNPFPNGIVIGQTQSFVASADAHWFNSWSPKAGNITITCIGVVERIEDVSTISSNAQYLVGGNIVLLENKNPVFDGTNIFLDSNDTKGCYLASANGSYRTIVSFATIHDDVPDYTTIQGNGLLINMPTGCFGYNVETGKFEMKVGDNYAFYISPTFIPLFRRYYNVQYGRLADKYIFEKAKEFDALNLTDTGLREKTFNASYHTGATDFATKCQTFSSLMYGEANAQIGVEAPSNIESFLFFTDPHLLEGRTADNAWQNQCCEFVSQIQKYYNSTPTTFCLCGGDWLGNSDLPDEACFKMGYIDGFMHSMFNECYMLVGNHDTNYQGKIDSASATYTTRLSNQSIVDLWYREGKKAYFTFNGANTKFYCFDTGTEGQQLTTFDNYGWEQAQWFATGLASETAEHIAIATHMLYSSGTTMQPLTEQILSIAEAYNSRTTTSVNGISYNFSFATGKVEFLIAGHNHADGVDTLHGIPCIRTIHVRANVSLGASFDLVFVNYDSREIKLIRVGSGSDRTVALSS